jgi:predicted metal-dependent phosphoesterase TrpH
MKKCLVVPALAVLVVSLFDSGVAGQDTRARVDVRIPDVLGFKTLKCDLHIHTVFSDGTVWPHIRSEEAWREGLDAISITDHIEYQPHKTDLPTNHNRSFEIAEPHGTALGVVVVRGSEITRDMPPGHLNAVFVENAEPIDTELWRDAVREADSQGAFIFWNHPGWTGQQPDGVARWYPEHTALVESGMLHGIEVVNTREYYPEAHRWCIEKKLTMLSNSDIHNPLNLDYNVLDGDHRPMTLVFAKKKSPGAIKEALFDRRTAVYSENLLIGEERFLRAIFEKSVMVHNTSIAITGEQTVYVQISNDSEIDYELAGDPGIPEVVVPDELVIQGGKTVLLPVRGGVENQTGTKRFVLSYEVENLLIAPEEGMKVEFELEITFRP